MLQHLKRGLETLVKLHWCRERGTNFLSHFEGLIDNHKHAGSIQIFDLDILLSGGNQVSTCQRVDFINPVMLCAKLLRSGPNFYAFKSFLKVRRRA